MYLFSLELHPATLCMPVGKRSSCGRDDSRQEECGCLGRDSPSHCLLKNKEEKLLAGRYDAKFNVWFLAVLWESALASCI